MSAWKFQTMGRERRVKYASQKRVVRVHGVKQQDTRASLDDFGTPRSFQHR